MYTQPSVVTGAMDINIEPGCGRATDSDMTLSNSLDSDDTIALGGRSRLASPQLQGSPPGPIQSNVST